MKRRFEDLKCRQMAREYRKAICKITKFFLTEEAFGLTNQLRPGYIAHLRRQNAQE